MKPIHLVLAALVSSVRMFAAPEPVDPSAYEAPVKVACVGDSITRGSGAEEGRSYPSQLQELLGDQWKVLNFGVSARTLLKKGDFPYWTDKAYQDALASSPDVVVIMLGTNDTKPQNWQHQADFKDDYTALVKSFRELESKPRIFVCRPVPVPGQGNFGINDKNLQECLKHFDEVVKELKLDVIDMNKALADRPELLPDRVHPNTEGAGEMAKAAFEVLTGEKVPEPVGK